jgi:hypothetical protein
MEVNAIKEVHAELLEPPERIRGNEEKLSRWRPPVKKDIDWDKLLGAEEDQEIEDHCPEKEGDQLGDSSSSNTTQEAQYLTIGLIGEAMSLYTYF